MKYCYILERDKFEARDYACGFTDLFIEFYDKLFVDLQTCLLNSTTSCFPSLKYVHACKNRSLIQLHVV